MQGLVDRCRRVERQTEIARAKPQDRDTARLVGLGDREDAAPGERTGQRVGEPTRAGIDPLARVLIDDRECPVELDAEELDRARAIATESVAGKVDEVTDSKISRALRNAGW